MPQPQEVGRGGPAPRRALAGGFSPVCNWDETPAAPLCSAGGRAGRRCPIPSAVKWEGGGRGGAGAFGASR